MGGWQEEWVTGHAIMDEDHRLLMAKAAELIRACNESRGLDGVVPLLAELMGACQGHFQREEQWMAEAGYPGRSGHIRHHQEMTEQLEMFGLRLAMDDMGPLQPEQQAFLTELFLSHIRQVDAPLVEFLKEKGQVKAAAATPRPATLRQTRLCAAECLPG